MAYISNNITDRFGFGNENQTSWWAADNYTFPMTGNRNYLDSIFNVRSFYANKKNDPAGVLLYGKINPFHTWTGTVPDSTTFNYTLELTSRIDPDYVSLTDTIAVIKIWEKFWSSDFTGSLMDTVYYYLKPMDFPASGYQGIKIHDIKKKNSSSSQLEFTVDWNKNCSLYIDKFSIYDQYYYDLFLAPENIKHEVNEKLISKLKKIPHYTAQDTNFSHLYIDEPAAINFRSIGRVSRISDSLSGGRYYINGALGNPADWDTHLYKFQRPDIPYMMSDIYPFIADIKGTQDALDSLIQSKETNAAGICTKGLRTMINYANNFTLNNPNDDKPFIQTIQVIEEYWKDAKGKWDIKYRAPQQNEILVQGWLALCYGAKGLMYYCTWTGGDNVYTRTEGLMSPMGYDIKSWPPLNQNTLIPNRRYFEVKELNRQIDQVSSELLKLTWKSGINIHKQESLGNNYITSIKSYTSLPGNIKNYDNPSQTFVELGEFRKSSEFLNDNLEYFILVNRRCLSSDLKHIAVGLDKADYSYTNWGIKDIAGGRSWTINKT